MTISDVLSAAQQRAHAFRLEETDARAQFDPKRAERCRQAAITLEEFGRGVVEEIEHDYAVEDDWSDLREFEGCLTRGV